MAQAFEHGAPSDKPGGAEWQVAGRDCDGAEWWRRNGKYSWSAERSYPAGRHAGGKLGR
jgi:hypothetical protein